MLQTYEDKNNYKKISTLLISFSLILFAFVTYVFFHNIMSEIISGVYLDNFLNKVFGETTIDEYLLLKLIPLSIALCGILASLPVKTTTREKKQISIVLVVLSALIYSGITFMPNPRHWGCFVVHHLAFIIFIFSGIESKKKLKENLREDRNEEEERQFDQHRELIEDETSVNLKYKYQFKGQDHFSWVNLINLFRAILVVGSPGSGKSFAIIEEIMRQFTYKGFAGVIYDFKFPTLTIKQWNYLNWYADNYETPPRFYMINFDDPRYSHRCNPMNEDVLQSQDDARQNATCIMYNLNKSWKDKEGEFFTESAMQFTSMLMWYVKLLNKKYNYDFCSLPHVIVLATFESIELLFMILSQYPELKVLMAPFAGALEKGALEQLAGQVSSAGVGLGKMNSKSIFYVLTGNDFSLDLNNPTAPKILCIGNNPERDMTYSSPIGLFLTTLTKVMNKQKRLKAFYIIDEFPTIFILGIDKFIATVRSNKVATVLGFQSFAQTVADYGDKIADKILKGCGSRIVGQVVDEEAEKVSKNLGKMKVVRKGNSTSSDGGTTESENISLEDIVPPERITQFSQGTFCGFFADTFADKDPKKIFFGDMVVPMEYKSKEESIPLPKIYEFMSVKEIEEQYSKIVEKYIHIIGPLVKFLESKTNKELLQIINTESTIRNFNNFLGRNIKVNFKEFTELDQLLNFQKNYKKNLEEEFTKSEKWRKVNPDQIRTPYSKLLERSYTNNEWYDLIENWLKNGIEQQAVDKNLDEHYRELFNDVYRIIMLEIESLGLIESINTDRKLKKLLNPFFKKIADSDNINDQKIRDRFNEFYELTKEEERKVSFGNR